MSLVDSYISYIASVRRYSPRTCENYRRVLEEYAAFCAAGEGGDGARSGASCAGEVHPAGTCSDEALRGGACSDGRQLHSCSDDALPGRFCSDELLPGKLCSDELLLEKMAPKPLRNYEVWLLDTRGEDARTVGQHLSVLSSFSQYLMKEGRLQANPVRLVSRPKTQKRLPAFYREESMAEYFGSTVGVPEFGTYEQQLARLVISILYNTGIRRSELIGLNRSDFDISRRVFHVLGKGDKMREIPLIASLCEEISLYLQSVDSKFGDVEPCSPLLLTPKGGRLYPVFVDRTVKKELGGVEGITCRKSPHVLRHTLATELLSDGADINSIKELLGHSSLAATQVYTHNSIERLQSVYQSAHPRAKNGGKNGD